MNMTRLTDGVEVIVKDQGFVNGNTGARSLLDCKDTQVSTNKVHGARFRLDGSEFTSSV